MDPKRRLPRAEAYICSNPSCRAYRFCDVADLRGETHCTKCNSVFKTIPELRSYKMVGIKGKGKGKGKSAHNNAPSEAKGGGKGKKGKGGPGQGTPTNPKSNVGGEKVVLTFSRKQLDDPIQQSRANLAFVRAVWGKDAERAQTAQAELDDLLQLREEERTPSQKAAAKRRQLKETDKKVVRARHVLDAAEEALEKAKTAYEDAKYNFQDLVVRADTLEEEIQYFEAQYQATPTPPGAQRDLLLERAHEIRERAILESGGDDPLRGQLQQAVNHLQDVLDCMASEPRKKAKTDPLNQSELPAVPEEQGQGELDARLGADVEEVDMDDSQNDGPTKASDRILSQHASRRLLNRVLTKGKGKGKGTKGDHKPHPALWPLGPTPAEAHAKPKTPGPQSPPGGEADRTAAPAREETPDPPDTSRNQGGDGQA